MNKAELVRSIETTLGGRKVATDAVEAVFDVIIREVAKGGKVAITGFGTFQRVAREARTGRNPRTGETVRITKTTVPRFRPGTSFKDVVADPAKLPADGPAATRAPARKSTGGKAVTKASATTGAKTRSAKTGGAKTRTAKASTRSSNGEATPPRGTAKAPAERSGSRKAASAAAPKKTTGAAPSKAAAARR